MPRAKSPFKRVQRAKIKEIAKRYIDGGVRVEVNRSLPYVSVGSFFVQGESAQELIEEVDKRADYYNVAHFEALLEHLDSSGAISHDMIARS